MSGDANDYHFGSAFPHTRLASLISDIFIFIYFHLMLDNVSPVWEAVVVVRGCPDHITQEDIDMARIAKKVVGVNGVVFTFANGIELVADLEMLSGDIVKRLALHGLSQKLGDSYASANEKGWSIDECYDQAADVFNNLKLDNWAVSGGSGSNILSEALSRLTGKTVAECATAISILSDDNRKALEKRPDVKAMVLTIKAERAAAKVPVSDGDDDVDTLIDMFR